MSLVLPDGVQILDQEAALAAILAIVKDAQVFGLAGSSNLPSVRCEVTGLTLGHWQALCEALGHDVLHSLRLAGYDGNCDESDGSTCRA